MFRRTLQWLALLCLFFSASSASASSLEPDVVEVLNSIAGRIGPGATNLNFKIRMDEGNTVLEAKDFTFAIVEGKAGKVILQGCRGDTEARWMFQSTNNGVLVTLSLSRSRPLGCQSLDSLIMDYSPTGTGLGEWRLLGSRGEDGMPRFSELSSETQATPADGAAVVDMSFRVLGGMFPNHQGNGIFLGTILPQHFNEQMSVRGLTANLARFTCTTTFIEGPSRGRQLQSESVWVCGHRSAVDAMNAFASFYPKIAPVPVPPAGWNSWDYYYNSVTLTDVVENMEAIRRDPVLSQAARYIVVDDGWQTSWGDWYPNYRFPGGLENLARTIKHHGFIPGIWTAPSVVHYLTTPGLRHAEMLVKDQYGDPYVNPSDSTLAESFILDPTQPEGRAFIQELYTRLYRAGFRYFKIDYIKELAGVPRLYDPTLGPYDAIREYLKIVRESVGPDSFILGCSLPVEAGPGLVNASRLGMDVHNQWTHVLWIFDSLVDYYWLQNRFWINDPDFLIVRGPETSQEKIDNVTNPNAHKPNPPRWRRGPEFNYEEAKTWASIVMLTGGSGMMSDRISALNNRGLELLRKAIHPVGVCPEPLDLCDAARPSLWVQRLPKENRLTVINWSKQPIHRTVKFSDYGLPATSDIKDFWTEKRLASQNGTVDLDMPAHGSAVLTLTFH